jgi:hypothetical protein
MAQSVATTSLIVRRVYALCLLGGTATHVWLLAAHGVLWDYGGVPLFTQVFWTSLTVLDPLAAILLFVRPRSGLAATLTIIATDVAHNVWFGIHAGLAWRDDLNWMFLSQLAFLCFVLATLRAAWRGVARA